MSKSTRPSARDLVVACRIAHEAAELGDDPIAWRVYLTGALQRRLLSNDGTGQACVMPQPIRPDAIGLELVCFSEATDPTVIALMGEYFAAGDLTTDPVTPAFAGQGPRSFVGFREQVCDDAVWYGSEYYNEWVRPTRHDDVLYSQVMIPWMGVCSGLGFRRATGSRPFTRRHATAVHVCHLEIGRLWRQGHAATAGLLSPRLWEVLDGVCRGLSAKQVAAELGLATTTAQDHVAALHQRLGVSSRGELVRAGLALQRRRGPAVLPGRAGRGGAP